MKAKALFITFLMIAGILTIYTGNFVMYLIHKSDAIIFVKDYVGAYFIPAIIYIFSGIIGAIAICDKYNWK